MNHESTSGQDQDDLGIAALEEDIAQTRAELGDTVNTLAARLDVKSQLKASAEQAKTKAVMTTTSHWREVAIVSIWAVLVTIVWKKL